MSSVFVRNLPFGVTQEELEHVFSGIGPVKKIDIIKEKGKRKDEMLTRGFAFVKFAIQSDAIAAIEKLNKTDFHGRKMLIDFAMEKGKRRGMAGSTKMPAAENPIKEEDVEQQKEEKMQVKETLLIKQEKMKSTQEDKTVDKICRDVKPVTPAMKAEANLEDEAGETSDEDESHEKTKPVKVKQEVKVEGISTSTATASANTQTTTHVQSERNARRRQHRNFLRDVERRKEEQASAQQKSVLLFGLGDDVTQKHVLKKAKKIGAVEKVNLNKEACTGKSYALVQFKTSKEAALAVAKLDHHIFKGKTLQVKIAANAIVAKSNEIPKKTAHSKHLAKVEGLRLIVRNLSFEATEKDLEELFEVYGPLFEVRIVRMPVKENTETNEKPKEGAKCESSLGRSRGFGFVQFRDIADAQAAVEKLNGTKLKGREMVVDFALSKTKFLEQQKEQARQADVDNEEANSGALDDDQLVMATDDEADCQLDDSVDEEEDHEEPGSKEDTEAQRERTLFIRNLSFQTTEDELRDFFLAFGAVEYARIVYEKGSGLSKGVGFVRFKSADVAAQVLKRGELPQVDSKQKHKSDWKKGTLSALADGGDDALTLHGRQLIVSRAVSKTDAEHLLDVNTREHRRRDKRNMYLAYEGTLNVNKIADAELELPQMDIDKRRRAIREKKLKLQNPMYFVSPVRLSVRNLSTSLDDRELKKLFHDAASTGMRAGNVDLSKIKPELLSKAPNPPIKVQMAKVLRDMESAKADQKPRSRGFGFVQFTEHLHALAALRELNNNPKYTMYAAGRNAASSAPDSSKSRLIVEFALENHGKLKLREKRAADAVKKRKEERALKAAQGDDEQHPEKKRKGRGQRQREKKLRGLAKVEAAVEGDKTERIETNEVKEVKQQLKKRMFGKTFRAEEEEDSLVLLEMSHVAKKVKTLSRTQRKKTKEMEQEKSFEEMVQKYKQEIFGENRGSEGTKSNETVKSGDRWFD
ncbi:hypothetical protein PsorP6_011672 [Peronosclerospora sorghi]|uniref:Uncharacterized protein n=1 Tax=Peronosclerospora sorghi TaxID=230839 RepID=A0ACC0WJN6_9STRA|nr:hypothetical protein PsorP6_011672 [Peronosclerospora sorghi]